MTVQQYGRSLPIYYASSALDISAQILKAISEHDSWISKHSHSVSEWSRQTFSDKSTFDLVLNELTEYTIQ